MSTASALAQAATSSYASPEYFRSNLYGVENQIDLDNAVIDSLLDINNYQLTKAINTAPSLVSFTWDGNVPLTTISKDAYGTTSLWWLILRYNGFIGYWDIPLGATLEIPDPSGIQKLTATTNLSNGTPVSTTTLLSTNSSLTGITVATPTNPNTTNNNVSLVGTLITV